MYVSQMSEGVTSCLTEGVRSLLHTSLSLVHVCLYIFHLDHKLLATGWQLPTYLLILWTLWGPHPPKIWTHTHTQRQCNAIHTYTQMLSCRRIQHSGNVLCPSALPFNMRFWNSAVKLQQLHCNISTFPSSPMWTTADGSYLMPYPNPRRSDLGKIRLFDSNHCKRNASLSVTFLQQRLCFPRHESQPVPFPDLEISKGGPEGVGNGRPLVC